MIVNAVFVGGPAAGEIRAVDTERHQKFLVPTRPLKDITKELERVVDALYYLHAVPRCGGMTPLYLYHQDADTAIAIAEMAALYAAVHQSAAKSPRLRQTLISEGILIND